MHKKAKFDMLYDNTLTKDNLVRVSSQAFPTIWTPQPHENNVGLFTLGVTGTFSGEIPRAYIVNITENGSSGEAKFNISRTGGDSFLGFNPGEDVWEAFTGENDRIVLFSPIEITDGISIEFGGSESGQVSDRFFFKGEYEFPIKNFHDLRPNRLGKSGGDQLDWEAVWDMGSYGFLRADLACFKGFNVPQLTVQANDIDTPSGWATAPVSEVISFIENSGVVDSVKQTRIVYNVANFQQKQLVGKHLEITSGTANGTRFLITDNYKNEIVIDGAGLIDAGVAVNDTFRIYGSDRYFRFANEFVHRYLRMTIPSGTTPESRFVGSVFKIGKSPDFDIDFQQGLTQQLSANIEITEADSGSEQVNFKGDRKRRFDVNFEFANDEIRKGFDAATTHLKDSKIPFIFIPDTDNSGEVLSVRFPQNKTRDTPVHGRFSETWTLEEVR